MTDKKKFKKIEEIQEDLKEIYEEDPKDWQVSVSKNVHDPNLFITNKRGIWQIKFDSFFKPKPIGLGVKVGDGDEAARFRSRKLGPSFGLRPLNLNHLDSLRRNIIQNKPIDNLIMEILDSNPQPIKKITSPLTLQGPVLFSNDPSYISDSQKQLDKKLKKELLKLSGSSYNYI
ncbi:MAG: hypothetical protein EAX96_17045 [Candidatus Lokiarchaeota archaeon]|nr:hypothetical protein [Candidatus Lokiarchaeota archaeon]